MLKSNKFNSFSKETVVLLRWESITGNLVLTTKLATVMGKKADVASVIPLSERLEGLTKG